MNPETFYLASSEGYAMEAPRRCRAIKRLKGHTRDDYLLIEVDPPFNGQGFGLGEKDLELVVVATRHREESLFPIKRWPVLVHVARLLISYEGQDEIQDGELESFAWAELYATEDAARRKAM